MRVLVAADKFKGSLTASQACDAIAAGLRRVEPAVRVDLCPLSDGGEGFVDTLTAAMGGTILSRRVTGPLPEMRVDARMGIAGETAIMEMSAAAGLSLLPRGDRNPLYTTTFGVGELIRFAVEADCRRVLLGIGGSATCDAGIGCLQACGCHVILRDGRYAVATEPLCGRDLDDVLMIKSHRGSRVEGVEIVVACDVTNPLYGPTGSAVVYGPQKGASPAEVDELDRMLAGFAGRCGVDEIARQRGSGAAGGIGFGLRAFLGARLERGIDIVMSAVDFNARVRRADLVITGEGKLDSQTGQGKLVSGVLGICTVERRPCMAICGDVDADAPVSRFAAVDTLRRRARDLDDAIARGAVLLEDAAAELMRNWAEPRRTT